MSPINPMVMQYLRPKMRNYVQPMDEQEIEPTQELASPDLSSPSIKDVLAQKYGDTQRQTIVDQNNEEAGDFNWGGFFSGLGAGIAGRDAGAATQAVVNRDDKMRENRLGQFDKGRENYLKEYLADISKAKNASELQRQATRDAALDKYRAAMLGVKNQEIGQKAIDRKLALEDAADRRLQDRKELVDYRKDASKELKEEQKKLKDQETLEELEQRRRDIEYNLSDLEKRITDNGTYELFGPHNEILTKKLGDIATDTAKLFDPKSVARPSEVEQAMKALFTPTATKMTNETALKILKNYRNDINRRANTAYTVRGLKNPGDANTSSIENANKESTGTEEVRTVKGRPAVFDSQTRKFIRWQ